MTPPDPAASVAAAAPPPAHSVARKRLWLLAKLLVVAGAFSFILARQSWSELSAALSRVAAPALAGGALLLTGCIVTATLRWRCLLRAYGADVVPPFVSLLRVYFVGQFYNTYLPGAVGGDLVRAVVVRRAFADGGATAGVAIVFVERALGLASVLSVSALAVPFGATADLRREFLPYCVLGLAGVVAVIGSIALSRRLAEYLPRRIASLLRALPALAHPGPFVLACMLSLVVQVLLSLCAHVLVASIYPEARPLDSLIAMPLAAAAAFFPLSVAGAGPRDLVLVTLYETLGIPRAAGAATALAMLLITLGVSGAGGVLQLLAPLTPPEPRD